MCFFSSCCHRHCRRCSRLCRCCCCFVFIHFFFAILDAFWFEKRNWDTLHKKCLTGECVVCLYAEQIFAIMSYYTAAHLYCFLMMASMRFLHINGVHRTKVLFLNIFFVFSLFLLSFPLYLPRFHPLYHSIFAKLQKSNEINMKKEPAEWTHPYKILRKDYDRTRQSIFSQKQRRTQRKHIDK